MQRVTIISVCYFTRYHTFSLSLAWFGAICNALLRVAIKFTKKYILIAFLKNVGNAWYRVANSPNPGKSQTKYMVTRVVARSSYGNTLRYSLSMFAKFEKLIYPYVISISGRFHKPSHLLLWNLLNK